MATKKRTTTPRKRRTPSHLRICVLACDNGENLLIRSNPTDEAVRGFVREQIRRRDDPAWAEYYNVMSAAYYPSELEYLADPAKPGEPLDLTDL